jgi:hypothetical protein
MRNITKFKRSVRAISPVVATLLMITIAIVASIVVYAWVNGYMGNTTSKAGNAILIQSLTTDQDSNLVAYVQNVGEGDLVLDSGYVNGELAAQSLSISLTAGATAAVTTTYLVTSDASLTIKVVATDGTFTQYTGSPNFENGQATTYPVTFNLGTGGASMIPLVGIHRYTAGTLIAVNTLASSGYQFSSWTSTGSVTYDSTTSASTTAHIDGTGTVTANFVAVQSSQNYQVTFNLGSGGSSMTPTGTQTYSGGSSVPVSAIALSGYQFTSWTSTGTISFDTATSVSTVAHINSAGSITANFIATQPTQNYQISWNLGTGGASMNPTGTQSYAGGSIVTISAVPLSGYQFSYWTATTNGFISFGSVTSAVTTAQISGSGTITANFAQIQTGQNYQVTFSTNGGGSSSTTNPTGTQTYTAGAIVPISATACPGYQFSSWSSTGSISFVSSASASTNAIINGEGTIIANFITPQTGQNYPVTFNLGTGGASMNPTGTQTYAGGSNVPISAVAASGYQFSSWISTGSISFDSTTSSSTTAHINSAGSITANFASITTGQNYQVTFALGTGGASMNPTGTNSYAAGSTVAISATPASGYRFSSWTSAGTISFDSATSASTNAHISSDGTITANFATNQHTITVTQGSNGVIAPGTTAVNDGASQTFSITPNNGYHVLNVVVDGSSKGAVTSWAFTNVQVDHTITATFASGAYHTITASAGANGQITPSGAVQVIDGGSQTYTITPNTGYVISSLTVDGTSVGYGQSFSFQNVVADHTISVTFTQGSTTINTGFDGNTWDAGWMAGGNPPWYVATGQGIDGSNAAKSDPNGQNSGAFTSDRMNVQGANIIRITFMYKVLNTNSNNDLRLAYSTQTAQNPNLNPYPNSAFVYDFAGANIGNPAQDNVWYVGSITLARTATPGAITAPTAFATGAFYFRFESNLSVNAGSLSEQVWIDNVIITLS